MWDWLSWLGNYIWAWIPILAIYNVFFKRKFEIWKDTQSRKKFEKRLLEIDVTIRCFEEYRKKPHLLFLYLINISVIPLTFLIFAFIIFFLIVGISPIPPGDWLLKAIFINVSIILMHPTLALLDKFAKTVLYFEHSNVLYRKRKELIIKAEKKKLISKDELEKFQLTDVNKEAVDKTTLISVIP